MHVRPVYHIIFWVWTMFHLRIFSIDTHKKCKFNHCLLLSVIFHDLRMTQFLSIKYICLVYKLKFLLWVSETSGNIYNRSVSTVFGTLFFSTFWLLKLQNLILMFSFYPKNGRNGSRKTSIKLPLISRRKLPDPLLGNVFNLLLIGLWYTLSFYWSDFGLKYLTTVMLKGQPPTFKASVWNFPISETGSKCNSVVRHANSNWVIIMGLKRKVEYSWSCTFWASFCFKGTEVSLELGME